MRIPHAILPLIRLLVLVLFVALCAGLFGYLWLNSGGRIPVISQNGYRVSVTFDKASNLVYDSDVMMAGIKIGKVADIDTSSGRAKVDMQLDDNFPLHQGATVQARNKTLIEETYLDITDGQGPEIANGAALPDSAAKPAVEVDEVLRSLDPQTREALSNTVQSLGASTADSRQAISSTLQGLGDLGRNGGTVLDALAAQSADLNTLSAKTATLLSALDTRQGEIAGLVTDADTVTKAVADSNDSIDAAMRALPPLLSTATTASGALNRLSGSLAPVAADLNNSAPALSDALAQLPQTSADLRGLLPSLDQTLISAPDTLGRVPAVAQELSATAKTVNVALSDVNPMLSYLQPYGRDVAAFFTNFAQALNRGDVNGKTLRIFMVFNEQALKGIPLNTNVGPLNKSNAYPAPGESANPGPFEGTYPRVQKDPPR